MPRKEKDHQAYGCCDSPVTPKSHRVHRFPPRPARSCSHLHRVNEPKQKLLHDDHAPGDNNRPAPSRPWPVVDDKIVVVDGLVIAVVVVVVIIIIVIIAVNLVWVRPQRYGRGVEI